MNREPGTRPGLLEWLARTEHEPGRGWEPEPPLDELRCHPDLIARLSEGARSIGTTRRTFVDGCPVIQHPRGRPIAAAAGTSWLVVRSRMPPGALAAAAPPAEQLGADWVELDPWAPDAAFAHATDLLRAHLRRAYERAEAEPDA